MLLPLLVQNAVASTTLNISSGYESAWQPFLVINQTRDQLKHWTVTACGVHCLTLQWRHNERGGVSNNQHHDCLHNRLFRRRSKETSKLRVTGLCPGNSSVIGLNLRYVGQKNMGLVKCTGWPSCDLDARSRPWQWLTKNVCLHDKIRSTLPFTTKLCRNIYPDMLIT